MSERCDIDANKKLILYLLGIIILAMGQSTFTATMPMLGRDLGLTVIQITSISGIPALFYFLFTPFWGRYSNSIGHYNCILLGLIGFLLFSVLYNALVHMGLNGLLQGALLYCLLLGVRILQMTITAATYPSTVAYIADRSTANNRTSEMSKLAIANSLGGMLGPILVASASFGLLMPLHIHVLLTTGVVVAIWWQNHRLKRPISVNNCVENSNLRLSFFDSRYRATLALGAAVYTIYAMIIQTSGFYLQDKLQLGSVEAAKLFGTLMLFSSTLMLSSWLAIKLIRLTSSQAFSAGVSMLLVSSWTLLLSTSPPYFILGFSVFGLGFGLFASGFMAYSSQCVSDAEQGALSGLTSAIPALGFIIGPIIGGFVYQLDVDYPINISSVTLSVLAVIAFRRLSPPLATQ